MSNKVNKIKRSHFEIKICFRIPLCKIYNAKRFKRQIDQKYKKANLKTKLFIFSSFFCLFLFYFYLSQYCVEKKLSCNIFHTVVFWNCCNSFLLEPINFSCEIFVTYFSVWNGTFASSGSGPQGYKTRQHYAIHNRRWTVSMCLPLRDYMLGFMRTVFKLTGR